MIEELIEWWSSIPTLKTKWGYLIFSATGQPFNLHHWSIRKGKDEFTFSFLGMHLWFTKHPVRFWAIDELFA